MRIERGYWISLVDRRQGKILYQCATDTLTDDEFATLWALAGKSVKKVMDTSTESQLELEIRAQKLDR